MSSMYCFQCQETMKNSGCTEKGVCGKTSDVANMQDLLIYVLKGISICAESLRERGVTYNNVNKFVTESLFATITNANFDIVAIEKRVIEGLKIKNDLAEKAKSLNITFDNMHDAATWFTTDKSMFEVKSKKVGVLSTENEDIRSLRELLVYGIKGMAAYIEHAFNLDMEDENIYAFMQKGLAATLNDKLTVDDLVALVLECGSMGVQAMSLLDKANTTRYGNPEITKVNLGVRNNPGILISGHDLRDMEDLLKQTENTGVDIYTHSEMLPAHYYPKFKNYSHFIGNYGGSWWRQREDFNSFNGPILFTTNCIVPPLESSSYKSRVYTTGASGYPDFKHIANRVNGAMKDFSEIIEHAKKCQPPIEIETGEIVGGFAHAQVFALADKVVDAIKSGAIKKFFVMGGCDGRQKGRNYYTEFAETLPKDTIILTAGCAKYRYNKLQLGDIGGIPRVLDAGQCNDSYSLALIALKLKELFNLDDINKLPIVFNIAWYEQKAVIVLLALLSLGVKNIHLGPTLPAFLSPNVVKVLVENFGIAKNGTVIDDINSFLN